jgi:acetolactate synthase-1/2/3 large subunit
MVNPDFVLLAKAMGVHAIRVSSADELPEKMKEFLEYDGNKPILLECIVESNEHVFPMVRISRQILSLDSNVNSCTGSCRQGVARTDLAPCI